MTNIEHLQYMAYFDLKFTKCSYLKIKKNSKKKKKRHEGVVNLMAKGVVTHREVN